MNTKEIAMAYRRSHWAQVIREQKESGLSIKAYCKREGIRANSYFYWQKKLREELCESISGVQSADHRTSLAPRFTEVQVKSAPFHLPSLETDNTNQIRVEVGGIRVIFDSVYPPHELAAMLRELTRPC